ncbi:hypothetical protein C0Z11_08495 [Acidipropionibacterium jensenii]|nr:hypothetical protein C0Z11_08495 [Acidipropionibacterium jensenii]
MLTRKVVFYKLCVLADGATSVVHDVEWKDRLAEYFSSPLLEDRKFELRSGDELVGWSTSLALQAILGRVLDGSPGISTGNWHETAAIPITPATDDEFLSRTTYLQFLSRSNVVAMVGGAAGRPSLGNIEGFVERIAPLDSGRHWKMVPVTQASQVARLKSMKGATKATIKTDVQPGLLPPDDDGYQQSMDYMVQQIAHNLGAGLRIELKISIRNAGDNPDSTIALKQSLLNSPGILRDAKKVSVDAYDEMRDEIVELIEHKVTAAFEMPDQDVDGEATEALVLDGLADVCKSLETDVCNAARLGH